MKELLADSRFDQSRPLLLMSFLAELIEICCILLNFSLFFFRRSKSTTLLNSGSSRSHAVYTLTLKSENLAKDVVFHVVDLAGAERR
jgi:Kinesin motor domain